MFVFRHSKPNLIFREGDNCSKNFTSHCYFIITNRNSLHCLLLAQEIMYYYCKAGLRSILSPDTGDELMYGGCDITDLNALQNVELRMETSASVLNLHSSITNTTKVRSAP